MSKGRDDVLAPARVAAGSPASTSRADQHLDLTVPLRARLGGVIALRSLCGEAPRLHAVGRDAGANQRVTNIADPLLAQGHVVLIAAAQEIRRSVDSELDGRILTHVGRDLGDLAHLDRPDLGLVVVKAVAPQGGPAGNGGDGTG